MTCPHVPWRTGRYIPWVLEVGTCTVDVMPWVTTRWECHGYVRWVTSRGWSPVGDTVDVMPWATTMENCCPRHMSMSPTGYTHSIRSWHVRVIPWEYPVGTHRGTCPVGNSPWVTTRWECHGHVRWVTHSGSGPVRDMLWVTTMKNFFFYNFF